MDASRDAFLEWLTPERQQIRAAVQSLCDRFDDEYWREKDRLHAFPVEFQKAIAEAGWLGIMMPEEYGGSGLALTDAALLMQTVGNSAGVLAACSTIHINIFGPHAIVVHGLYMTGWIPTGMAFLATHSTR